MFDFTEVVHALIVCVAKFNRVNIMKMIFLVGSRTISAFSNKVEAIIDNDWML